MKENQDNHITNEDFEEQENASTNASLKDSLRNKNLFFKVFFYIKHCIDVFTQKVTDTRIAANAGMTSYMIILSFIPFFIFTIMILRTTALPSSLLMEMVESLIPPAMEGTLMDPIKEIIKYIYRTPSGSFWSITTIMAIWFCSRATLAIITGLNDVYEKKTLNYIPARFKSIIYIIVLVAIILTSLIVVVFGNRLVDILTYHFPSLIPITDFILNIRSSVSFVSLLLLFTVMYKFMPNHYNKEAKNIFMLERKTVQSEEKISLISQIPGALFSIGFWFIFSAIFAAVVNMNDTYSTLYGTMATVAMIMVWLYFCLYAFFLGGLINSVLYNRFFKHNLNLITLVKWIFRKLFKSHKNKN